VANADTLKDFSAVCYFTARELDIDSDIPIGLIDSTWGGTRIESWMSLDSLKATELRKDDIKLFETYKDDQTAGMKAFGDMWDNWWRVA